MITYADKVQVAVNPLAPEEQFRAVDANEIKNEVNSNITATAAAQATADAAQTSAQVLSAINSTIGTATQAALDAKIGVSDFQVLTDGATVNWNCANQRLPLAKLTSTQSFTLNMTNVLSGSTGLLKILTSTASAIVITFDTDFTNKSFGNTGAANIMSYTLPAGTGREYTIQFVVDGTTIYWYFNIVPPTLPFTTTFTGFSVNPTTVEFSYVHQPDKKLLDFELVATGGTSDNAAFTFVLPVAARALTVHVCQIINSGAPAVGIFATRLGLTTVDVYNGMAFGGFTASGSKGIRCAATIQTI